MSLFRQIGAVTAMNFKSLPHRVGTSIVIVIGIAGVVAVLVSVLAMSTGMLETMEHSGRDDRAIVLRNGSASEMGSALGRDAARLVEDAPGVKRDSNGKPIASAEDLRLVNLFRKEDGAEVNVTLRGVGPQLHALRPELKIVEGRMFRPAVTEIIVGKAAHARVQGPEHRRPDQDARRDLDGGRRVHDRRRFARVGADDRCGDADLGRAARQLPERDRTAGVGGRVPEVQGRAQLQPGARRRRESRARVLPPAVGDHRQGHLRHRLRGRRHHGCRRDLQRAQHDVLRRQRAPTGDRDACARSASARRRW